MHSSETNRQLSGLLPFPWQKRQWAQLLQQKNSGQLAHAYLVQGSQGLGKNLLIEKFAQCLLCLKKDQDIACGQCTVCKMATSGALPDLLKIQPEEGSRDIKIDQIRLLSRFINKTSHAGSGKVVILNKAHSLNNSAENALLKTLEEPSESTFIFLITDLPGALSATIRSRCQRLQFSITDTEEAEEWLQRNQEIGQGDSSQLAGFATKPLLAFTEENVAEQSGRRRAIASLEKLLETNFELRSEVSALSKFGELVSIGYLIDVSTILIKEFLLSQNPPVELAALMRQLSQLCGQRAELVPRLMAYQQDLVQARRQLMSGSNPNPQLIMESLLWKWVNIAT